jgi:hypothetical protein
LAIELIASQAEKAMLAADLKDAVAKKEKASVGKDQASAERDWAGAEKEVAMDRYKETYSQYQKLCRKYNHYKAKARRLSNQLSFIHWLRDLAWTLGFNWGFENFRTLALYPTWFNFSPKF